METPDEPSTKNPASGDAPAGRGIFRHLRRTGRLSRRAVVVAIVLATVVVAGGTTVGVEATHVLTSTTVLRANSQTPIEPLGPPPTTPPTSGSSSSSSSQATPGAPSEGAAPQVPVSGGWVKGSGALNALDCIDPTTCIGVGADNAGNGLAATTTDGGKTWSPHSVPKGTGTLDAVACTSRRHCVAGGVGSLVSTSDGGGSWAFELPPPDTTVLGVTCASSTLCLAVGVVPVATGPYGGVILRSSDGGASWQQASVPPGTPGLGSVSCTSARRCIAVGATILVSSDGGRTWKVQTVQGGVGPLTSISCTTTAHCLAVGGNPAGIVDATAPAISVATSDGGSTWSDVSLPPGSASLDQVTCPSAAECFTAGVQPRAHGASLWEETTDGGASWQPVGAPSGLSAIAGVSCPHGAGCVVVGRAGKDAVSGASASGVPAGPWAVHNLGRAT